MTEVSWEQFREICGQLMVGGWMCPNCGGKLRRPTKKEIKEDLRESTDRICQKCGTVYGIAKT